MLSLFKFEGPDVVFKESVMISYIRGLLAEKMADSVVVEAGGVGYQIYVPTNVLGLLPKVGEEVRIYTYFSVNDSGVSLFGFLSRNDLEMFKMLIGVNGVGPKSAVGILSAIRPDDLRMAVVTDDVKTLAKAPGVGAKTAQRIILDLKDKVSAEEVISGMNDVPKDQVSALGIGDSGKEAIEALTALGYSAGEAAAAVRKVDITEDMTSEDVLRASLKHLAFL